MGFRNAIFFAILSICAPALAGVSLNAGCELHGQKPTIGTNLETSFPMASLSKIFTTHWALKKIGYDFQYETRITVEPLGSNIFNVHISGDADPTWGRQMMHYLISELDRLGVRKIKTLSFDENFLLAWRAKASVVDKKNVYYDFTDLAGAESEIPNRVSVEQSLARHFVPRATEYKQSLASAAQAQLELVANPQVKAPAKIQFVEAAKFTPGASAKTFSVKSLPLYQILKLMNVTSNNYLADMLFLQMGGVAGFSDFLNSSELSSVASAIDMRNGSGYPIKSGESKFYNHGSCAAIVSSLKEIDNALALHNLALENVFPVATSDKSTLDKYELPADVMIAKTGTINPTIALAGMVLTKDGPLYFSQLIKTESAKDWVEARALIKDYLLELIENQGTALGYSPSTPPFWAGVAPSPSLPKL